MLDPLLLRTFLAILDQGGFGRAAAHLHLTQSTISGHMQRLETQLERKLFKRTTRHCELTLEGQCLVSYARAIVALNQKALDQFAKPPAQGCLRLGIMEDFAHPLLFQLIQHFKTEHTTIQVNIQIDISGNMLKAMEAGLIDMVIGSHCASSDSGLLLWQEPLVWASAIKQDTGLTYPLPLALFPEPCPYREAALTELAYANIPSHIVMIAASGSSLRAAVASGFAIAPMPLSQLNHDMVALGYAEGLPHLPSAAFKIFSSEHHARHPSIIDLQQAIIHSSKELRLAISYNATT